MNLWNCLQEYICKHNKYIFIYIEFLLTFLNECKENCFESKIITCENVISILKEIISKNLSQNSLKDDEYEYDKSLIVSYISKISSIFAKKNSCIEKSLDVIKKVFSHPIIFQQIIHEEEILQMIFNECFEVKTENLFLYFLSLSYSKLKVLSDEAFLFRNRFFEIVRKYFMNFNYNSENNQKKQAEIYIWKLDIIGKLFEKLLISSNDSDFEKFKFVNFNSNREFLNLKEDFVFRKVYIKLLILLVS